MMATASTMGSAVLAGISSGRTPRPRQKIVVPSRWDPSREPDASPCPVMRKQLAVTTLKFGSLILVVAGGLVRSLRRPLSLPSLVLASVDVPFFVSSR